MGAGDEDIPEGLHADTLDVEVDDEPIEDEPISKTTHLADKPVILRMQKFGIFAEDPVTLMTALDMIIGKFPNHPAIGEPMYLYNLFWDFISA